MIGVTIIKQGRIVDMKMSEDEIKKLEGKTIANTRTSVTGFTLEFEDGTEVKFGDNSGIGIGIHWED